MTFTTVEENVETIEREIKDNLDKRIKKQHFEVSVVQIYSKIEQKTIIILIILI